MTWRQLETMVRARRRAEWERTAWVAHVIVNSNPYREGPPITPAECNPLADDDRPPVAAATTGIDCTDPDQIAAYHDAIKIREERQKHGR